MKMARKSTCFLRRRKDMLLPQSSSSFDEKKKTLANHALDVIVDNEVIGHSVLAISLFFMP